MANGNKYMGKVVPLEESLSSEAKFRFSNRQTLGSHGGELLDLVKMVGLKRLNFLV